MRHVHVREASKVALTVFAAAAAAAMALVQRIPLGVPAGSASR